MSRISKGMMSDLIRQNLGKSTLNLRILRLAFIIIAVWHVVSAEDMCSVDGFAENDQQRLCLHTDKNSMSKRLCCVAIECPKGNEAVLCDKSDPASTACVECKPGTFQAYQFNSCYAHAVQCKRHRECGQDSRVLLKGNSTTNTVCECNVELGFYGNWSDCHRDKTCGPGLQLRLDGSCENCPQNFHKASGGVTQCIPCSVCDKSMQQSIQSPCTATHDTVCSSSSFYTTENVSAEDGVGVSVITVLISVLVVLAFFVLMAFVCYKCICKDKAREQVGTSPTSTSVSSDLSSVMSQGAETKALLIDNTDVPISTVGQCGVTNCRHKDATLSCIAPQLGANQQTPFPPSEHQFDFRDDRDVTYEVEVENSERHGAQQIPKTNVKMNGKMNIYGEHVVVNINNNV